MTIELAPKNLNLLSMDALSPPLRLLGPTQYPLALSINGNVKGKGSALENRKANIVGDVAM